MRGWTAHWTDRITVSVHREINQWINAHFMWKKVCAQQTKQTRTVQLTGNKPFTVILCRGHEAYLCLRLGGCLYLHWLTTIL